MKNRLPIALSVTALVVALMGATGIANAVVVSFAANAGKLSGFKASKSAKKNTVVVRGKNGKIDARSIPAQARGARGTQGSQGVPGPQGPKGDPGAVGGPAGGSLAGTYPNPSLAPNSVGRGQIAADAVNSAKVLDESLAGDDIGNDSLTGSDISNDSLTGSDIDESTLGRVPSALLGGFGRTSAMTYECNPTSATFVTCTSITVNLPAPTRVLVIGRVKTYGDTGWGYCALITVPGGVVPNSEISIGGGGGNAPLIGVTNVLPAGAVLFALDCNQQQGSMAYEQNTVTAVALSAF